MFDRKEPHYVPVFHRNQAQMIYSMGWKHTDVTGQDWYDAEKVALAALWNPEYMDYDLHGVGVVSLMVHEVEK